MINDSMIVRILASLVFESFVRTYIISSMCVSCMMGRFCAYLIAVFDTTFVVRR